MQQRPPGLSACALHLQKGPRVTTHRLALNPKVGSSGEFAYKLSLLAARKESTDCSDFSRGHTFSHLSRNPGQGEGSYLGSGLVMLLRTQVSAILRVEWLLSQRMPQLCPEEKRVIMSFSSNFYLDPKQDKTSKQKQKKKTKSFSPFSLKSFRMSIGQLQVTYSGIAERQAGKASAWPYQPGRGKWASPTKEQEC